jgi:O-methyltransferase
MGKIVKQLFAAAGFTIYRTPAARFTRYGQVLPEATYAPWDADQGFLEVYNAIRGHTLVDPMRCYELWALLRETATVEGDVIEVGVWRGGTGGLIAKRVQQLRVPRTVWLCDTFKGVVKTGGRDAGYADGKHSDTSRSVVEHLVGSLGIDNVRILEGTFPEESAAPVRDSVFSFGHIDVDVYQSARDVFEWLWPRLSVGGVIVFDDYGFQYCSGVTRFVDDLRGSGDRVVIHNLNGHAIVVKT